MKEKNPFVSSLLCSEKGTGSSKNTPSFSTLPRWDFFLRHPFYFPIFCHRSRKSKATRAEQQRAPFSRDFERKKRISHTFFVFVRSRNRDEFSLFLIQIFFADISSLCVCSSLLFSPAYFFRESCRGNESISVWESKVGGVTFFYLGRRGKQSHEFNCVVLACMGSRRKRTQK